MFEDNQKETPQAPKNLPVQEPDDMFAEVEKKSVAQNPANSVFPDEPPNALEAGLLKKKEEGKNDFQSSPQQVSQSEMTYKMKDPILGKVLLVIFLILILLGLGFGGFWFYNSFMKGSMDNTEPILSVDNIDGYQITEENKMLEDANLALEQAGEVLDGVGENVEMTTGIQNTEISQEMDSDEILFGEPIDSDQDGLDDVRENELGTNPNSDDTDKDGLRDADEVLIWGTDPLLSDTDGDTYLDGEEINNGFNPLGEGKLINPVPVVVEETTTTK